MTHLAELLLEKEVIFKDDLEKILEKDLLIEIEPQEEEKIEEERTTSSPVEENTGSNKCFNYSNEFS